MTAISPTDFRRNRKRLTRAELEALACELWGLYFALKLRFDDPYVESSFRHVDARCREAGLMATPMKFNPPQTEQTEQHTPC